MNLVVPGRRRRPPVSSHTALAPADNSRSPGRPMPPHFTRLFRRRLASNPGLVLDKMATMHGRSRRHLFAACAAGPFTGVLGDRLASRIVG